MLVLRLVHTWFALYLAMAVGTGLGLISKYLLDKTFIFAYRAPTAAADLATFVFYSATGVLTTGLFWATELGVHALWDHPVAKYVGAVIGLSLGYVTKYQLDKRLVFREGS